MKKQNFAVKFKNSFLINTSQHQSILNPILSQSLSSVTSLQLQSLIQLYTRNTFENGYNYELAYRIIILYAYSKADETIKDIKQNKFQLKTQVDRFFNHRLNSDDLQSIRDCGDLIMVRELVQKLTFVDNRYFKIRFIDALNQYYHTRKQSANRKSSSQTLRTIITQTLKHPKLKHQQTIYCHILDIYISFQTRQTHINLHKPFKSLQSVNNLLRVLESNSYQKSIKYQREIMLAYWYNAQIHQRLGYVVYTKKYCQIVTNIAKRLKDQYHQQHNRHQMQQINECAQELLEKVII